MTYSAQDMERLTTTAPELEVYKVIEFLGGALYYTAHDLSHGYISDKDKVAQARAFVAECRAQSACLVDSLTRFGVAEPQALRPIPAVARKVWGLTQTEAYGPTPEYWRWYRWWDKWWKSLARAEQDRISTAAIAGLDVSSYRPPGDWRSAPEED